MKIQCSCGAKFEFELTPELARSRVGFVCPVCGRDSSEFVDALVRRELGQSETPLGPSIDTHGQGEAVVPAATQISATQPPQAEAAVQREQRKARELDSVANRTAPAAFCLKHPRVPATERCRICGKPICPKCMELFGYVCSPLCKAKAESHGVHIPVYEGQKTVRQARLWRKVAWGSGVLGVSAALVLGFWFWYAWFGSIPASVFSARFPEVAYSGKSAFGGKKNDQIVVLHGATLARYAMKPEKEVWSLRILDHQRFAELADAQLKAMQQRNLRLADQGVEDLPRIPSAEKLADQAERSAAEDLTLYVRGENIWVASPGKLVRYDWESGKPVKELPVRAGGVALIAQGDELRLVDATSGRSMLTRIDLTTCEMRTEDFEHKANEPGTAAMGAVSGEKDSRGSRTAGLPLGTPGRDLDKAMDPSKVAEQAQHLSLPQRMALPATLANAMNQERALAVLNDQPGGRSSSAPTTVPKGSSSLILTKGGLLEFSMRVLESRIVERSAVKPVPAKSALEGGLTAGSSMDAASGILNEMQRERGGDTVHEDLSRYEVTLRQPGVGTTWTGEVVGPPRLFPLQTVNILAASKTIIVLDQTNKKLWQSPLSFDLAGGAGGIEEQSSPFGQGPCVERQGVLYVFDQGFLAAFDLATGNRRWGLPSVGITGLFFDDHNMLYVNTTTASPEKVRYSRQIDLSEKANAVVLKVDSKTGKVLWNAEQAGLVSYVFGKLVLTVQRYQPPEEDESAASTETGFETPPYLRIRRLDWKTGREVWEHFQQRAPLDIGFERNTIRLVFKKELQVLKFIAL